MMYKAALPNRLSNSRAIEPSQIAKFMGPTWGPPGSCRPQMGPMNLVIRDPTSPKLCTREISHNKSFCKQKCAYMCTFLLQNCALWDMGLVYCGICATGQFANSKPKFRGSAKSSGMTSVCFLNRGPQVLNVTHFAQYSINAEHILVHDALTKFAQNTLINAISLEWTGAIPSKT